MCNDSPTLSVYDTNPDQYKTGDVVIFNREDGQTVRHRLIEDKHNTGNYVTKGDCNKYRDYGLNYKNSIEKEELETYLKGKQIASYELL